MYNNKSIDVTNPMPKEIRLYCNKNENNKSS